MILLWLQRWDIHRLNRVPDAPCFLPIADRYVFLEVTGRRMFGCADANPTARTDPPIASKQSVQLHAASWWSNAFRCVKSNATAARSWSFTFTGTEGLAAARKHAEVDGGEVRFDLIASKNFWSFKHTSDWLWRSLYVWTLRYLLGFISTLETSQRLDVDFPMQSWGTMHILLRAAQRRCRPSTELLHLRRSKRHSQALQAVTSQLKP